MTIGTDNPVPSDHPLDLLANAQNFDDAMNSSASTFTDRFGVSRVTWAGITTTENLGDAIDALPNEPTISNADNLIFSDTSTSANGAKKITWDQFKTLLIQSLKDITGGFVGMTLFKINFKNAANTFTSFFTNTNTAARTYTFPDASLTIDGFLAVDTVANVLANYPAASWSGYKVKFTNVNNSVWQSDGTNYKPMGGRMVWPGINTPMAIACTFTPTNGTNAFTLGTAANTSDLILSGQKFWMYFPTGAGLTAGWFTVTMSTTTAGVLYSADGVGLAAPTNTHSSSTAFTFNSGVAVTGSTSEITCQTITIPGNLLSTFGEFTAYSWLGRSANGASTTTHRIRVAGTSINPPTMTSTITSNWHQVIFKNFGATNRNFRSPSANSTFTAVANALMGVSTSLDTSVNFDVTWTIQHTAATEIGCVVLGRLEIIL